MRRHYLDSARVSDSLAVLDLKKSNENMQEQFDAKSAQYDNCDIDRQALNKEITKQKVLKWFGYAAATAIAALEVYREIRFRR